MSNLLLSWMIMAATKPLSETFSTSAPPMQLQGFLGPKSQEEPTEFFAVLELSGNSFTFEMRERDNYQDKYQDINRIKVKLPNSQDIRETGGIREKTVEEILKQLRVIKAVVNNLLLKNHKVYLKAIGTAAMRDASNCAEIEQQIFDLAGIEFDKIDGLDEAELCAGGITLFYPEATGLAIDMGGGSTEFALIKNGSTQKRESLGFGTASISSDKNAKCTITESLNGLGKKFKNVETLYLSGGTFRNINKALCEREGWDIKGETSPKIALKDYKQFIAELLAMSEEEWADQPSNLGNRREFLPAALVVVERLGKMLPNGAEAALTKTKTRDGIFRSMEEELSAYEEAIELERHNDENSEERAMDMDSVK